MTTSKKCSVKTQLIIHLLIAIVLIILDQITKLIIRNTLAVGESIKVWPGVFEITFLKNDGAVWGMFSGRTNSVIFLTIITIIILVGIFFLYFKIPMDRKYHPIKVLMMFIIAGAIGNLIDRIFLAYVTDFLYIALINFPVFNVADCYITVSCFLLVILMLTKYRNDDLEFLSFKPKKKDEQN